MMLQLVGPSKLPGLLGSLGLPPKQSVTLACSEIKPSNFEGRLATRFFSFGGTRGAAFTYLLMAASKLSAASFLKKVKVIVYSGGIA